MVPQEKISYRKYQQLKVTEQNDTSIETLDIIVTMIIHGNQMEISYIYFFQF